MKYRKKPVEVDAIKYTGDNIDSIRKCFPKMGLQLIRQPYTVGCSADDYREVIEVELKVTTLEGNMKVNNGDWIIKGIAGEFYPVKPDIFEKTYEKVEEK